MVSVEDRRYVLLAAALSSFVIPFTGSAVNLAIPQIGKTLHLNAVTLNWVVTAYLVSSAAALLPLGRAADVIGRRRVFLAGLICFAISSLACGISASGSMLIFMRVLQGVSGAMIFGTGLALVTAAFPANERGRALGVNIAAVYAGLSFGPPIGGFLTHNLGWRSIFISTFVLGLAAAIAVWKKMPPESGKPSLAKIDFPGGLVYTTSLATIMAGIALAGSNRAAGWLLAAGALLFALFIWMQLRSINPLLHLELFRNRAFTYSNLAALIHYCATFASGYLVSVYLQVVKGVSAQQAGFIMLIQPVIMTILSPVTGRLSDRFSPRILASCGMLVTLVGLALFFLLEQDTPDVMVMLNLLFVGIGFALFSSPNTNAVMSAVDRQHYGLASAIVGTMRLVGQALSMVLVSLFVGLYVGRVTLQSASPEVVLRAATTCFGLFAIICLAGLAASMARGPQADK